jgi:Uma2 family endonuclease
MSQAMPILSTTKMTAEQFLQLGEDPPGVRLELVEGEIAVRPSPMPQHSYAEIKLIILLGNHIDARKSGELHRDVDTILNPFTVRRPDILYFSKERTHLIGKKAMHGPPDLAVEIISPSSVDIDRTDKFAQYRDAGVAYYWIVDPIAKTIEAWRLEEGQFVPAGHGEQSQVVQLPPFPDLAIPLSQLWRE